MYLNKSDPASISAQITNNMQPPLASEKISPTKATTSNMSLHGETASLESIPAEVRSMIFKYILPTERLDFWIWLDKRSPLTSYVQQNDMEEKSVEQRWHLDILRVNRLCRAHAVQMIHDRTVSLRINRTAFEPWYCLGDVFHNYKLAESKGLIWKLGLMMPGMQFSLIKEFELVIEPINVPGYWYCVRSLLQQFCEEYLESDGPLRTITVTFMDMVRNTADPSFPDLGCSSGASLGRGNSAISARFEDYETTLGIFSTVIKASKRCNIQLPYWMATHRRAGALMKQCVGLMGANVSFTSISTWMKLPSEAIEFDHNRVPVSVLREDLDLSCGWWNKQGPRYSECPGDPSREMFPRLADLE